MKTNAPAEIYILPDDSYPNGLSVCWYEAPFRTDAIEYTRTDAFIEKIEEYIYKQLNEGCIECGDIGMFIENMKKYMKG